MKSFFKYLFVLLSGYLILIVSVIIFIAILFDTEPLISDNSYLEMSVGGSLPEYVPPNPFEELTGVSRTLDMKKIRENLEKAAVDDRINGVILRLGFLQTGYSKIDELQRLIKTYRKSGKKIYAFLEFALTKEYLVALACDSIFMPENSNLFLTGVGGEVTFYKGLFEKAGIKADFVHVGEYKNAPDQYTREDMSAEQREVLDDILDQFYDFVIANIAEHRNLDKKTVSELVNEVSGFTGKDALEYGLVDGNVFVQDVEKLLNIYNDEPGRISGMTYSMIPISSLSIRDKSRFAVIHVSGTIASGNDVDDPLLGKLAGANTIVKNINDAAESYSTKAIILRIDSPGGSAIASDLIWHAVKKAAEKKPVIASISDYGASGGYYIAAGADTIIAGKMSLIGSIGIYAGKFAIGGLYDKLGINTEQILRGKNASLFSTSTLWSDSERKIMQRLLEDYYENFVAMVADNRNKSYTEIDNIARGRVWSGKQGVELGLADSSGTFYDALDLAKKMAGIDLNESVRLSYYPREKDFFTELYSFVSMKTDKLNLLKETEFIFVKNYQNHPLALMPFIIEWK